MGAAARRSGWPHTSVRVRGRDIPLRYRVEGLRRRGAAQQPLFLLVVRGIDQARGHDRCRRKPAFFLVNAVLRDRQWALRLPAEDLLAWAWQRWEVEVAHRAMTSDCGVGEAQCWQPQATVRAVQMQAWTRGILMASP